MIILIIFSTAAIGCHVRATETVILDSVATTVGTSEFSGQFPTEFYQTGTSGTIELQNYENNIQQTWQVDSNCHSVQIISTQFQIEYGFDHLV